MRNLAMLHALASASAIGIAATAAELQAGRLMRAPDHPYQHQPFPSWRYGPNGEAVVVNSEEETPKGFSEKRNKDGAGTHTAIAPSNGTTSAETASKTTSAKSQTATDPAKAAKAGVGGEGNSGAVQPPVGKTDETNPNADPSKIELDTDGHPYDPSLHATTKSKTKDGRWRMKVGVARPAPAPGYPLDL